MRAVVVGDDVERLHLVAGTTNRLRCWIGPERGEFAITSDATVPSVGRDVTLEVDLLVGRDPVARGRMFLPVDEASRSSDCVFELPPVEPGTAFAAELAFTVDGRMYELVSLSAVVPRDGETPDESHALRLRSLVRHRQVIALDDRSTSEHTLDVSTLDDGLVVRVFGSRAPGVYDVGGTRALVRTLMRQLYGAETSLVRRDLHGPVGADPDPEWTSVLRAMATHGWLLHRELAAQGFEDPGTRFEIVNRVPGEYVPVELVYDRGAPAPDAFVDPACMDALRTGADDCGRCHPLAELTDGERDANPRICPFGFWSLGKVIERHDADGAITSDAPDTTRRRLQPMRSVLAGWSRKLRDEDQQLVPTGLARPGRIVHVAADWTAWRNELVHAPGILLALPHHDEADGIGTLEIGGDDSLGLQRALDLFVRTPAGTPGPVLLLLGCETDTASELGHPSFARAFSAHASVVIGTLSKVLGRHAVPFAHRLVDALVEAQGTGGDVGVVMRDVRRRMFADGYLMALGVIALGDADWRFAGPTPTEDDT